MSQATLEPPAAAVREINPDEATRFRRAMGRIPSGVAVIATAAAEGRPAVAMTVATVAMASANPPMLAFFAQKSSARASTIIESNRFVVSLLGRGQEAECYRFATSATSTPDARRPGEDPWSVLRVPGAVLWAECTIASVVVAGDHSVVIAHVDDFALAPGHAQPLIFYKSKLAVIDPASGRHVPTELLDWW